MQNRREEDLRIALDCSDRAAELALTYFRAGMQTIVKSDGSPVTDADSAVEQLPRQLIEAASPDDEFIDLVRGEFAARPPPAPFARLRRGALLVPCGQFRAALRARTGSHG